MRFGAWLYTLATACMLAWGGAALADSFRVEVSGVDRIKQAFGIPAVVYVSGEIDTSSPEQLDRALRRLEDIYYWVYLDSPGGNFLAGMELGRVIRKHRGTTIVAVPDLGKTHETRPGHCYSACALAFLGGAYRLRHDGSVYGVHRAFKAMSATNDLDLGQVIAAAMGAYIREMGVDPALYDLIASAGGDEIRVLNDAEQTQLLVVNEGRMKSEWSIEALEGGIYLRGVQHTIHGMGKAMFLCSNGNMFFWSVYDAGDRSAQLAKSNMVHSLFVDDKTVRLSQGAKMFEDGGWLNAIVELTREQGTQVMRAQRKIGHAMQMSYEAPSFVGYWVDIDVDSASKVHNFLANCVAAM